jgi:nicotinamidase-related amidase
MSGPRHRGLIERDDSMLFVIDVQEGFLRKLVPAQAEGVVASIRFVVEVARRVGVPIVVTTEDAGRNGPTVPAIRAVLDPQLPEFDKSVFGLAGQPDLAARAAGQPRRTAILVGLETDVCVLHSAVGLAELGFRSVIVADATASPGAEHDWGLRRARALGIELIRAKGLYYEWARSLDGCRSLEAGGTLRPPAGVIL